MQLASEQLLPVAQTLAWDALNDIDMLKSAIPGCESITPSGENEYEVVLMAAIGPVKARFKGKLRLADITPPDSYVIYFEGQGGAAGHGKGNASVHLEPAGEHETRLIYSATAQVGGKIAQIGSRLVDMAAQKMAGEFFGNFTASLKAKYPAAIATIAVETAEDTTEEKGLGAKVASFFKKSKED